jgi:hypothetical protein
MPSCYTDVYARRKARTKFVIANGIARFLGISYDRPVFSCKSQFIAKARRQTPILATREMLVHKGNSKDDDTPHTRKWTMKAIVVTDQAAHCLFDDVLVHRYLLEGTRSFQCV